MTKRNPYNFARFQPKPLSPQPTKAELIETLQLAFWLLWDECTENDEDENTRFGGKTRSNFLTEYAPKSVQEWVWHGDEPAISQAEIVFDKWLDQQ